jgi:hypothetical protein
LAGQQQNSPVTAATSDVPVTRLAQQGSIQLSLETPQNKAGKAFGLVSGMMQIITYQSLRICAVYVGQSDKLG